MNERRLRFLGSFVVVVLALAPLSARAEVEGPITGFEVKPEGVVLQWNPLMGEPQEFRVFATLGLTIPASEYVSPLWVRVELTEAVRSHEKPELAAVMKPPGFRKGRLLVRTKILSQAAQELGRKLLEAYPKRTPDLHFKGDEWGLPTKAAAMADLAQAIADATKKKREAILASAYLKLSVLEEKDGSSRIGRATILEADARKLVSQVLDAAHFDQQESVARAYRVATAVLRAHTTYRMEIVPRLAEDFCDARVHTTLPSTRPAADVTLRVGNIDVGSLAVTSAAARATFAVRCRKDRPCVAETPPPIRPDGPPPQPSFTNSSVELTLTGPPDRTELDRLKWSVSLAVLICEARAAEGRAP